MSWSSGKLSPGTLGGPAKIVIRASSTSVTAAPTVALRSDATAGQVDAGTHVYALVPVTALGRGQIGTTSATLTNDASHTSNTVTVPALSGAITSYDIIRSKAGVTTPTFAQWFLVAAAQAPGAYIDSATDASLAALTAGTNTTLQNDDTLLFPVAANDIWFCEAFLYVSAVNTTMDAQIGWSVPSGTTMKWAPVHNASTNLGWSTTGAAGNGVAVLTASSAYSFGTLNGTFAVELKGSVFVSSTAGTVTLQWAQVTGDAGVLGLLAGSFLRLTRQA